MNKKLRYETKTIVTQQNDRKWSGTVHVQAISINNQIAFDRVSTVDVYSISSLLKRFGEKE